MLSTSRSSRSCPPPPAGAEAQRDRTVVGGPGRLRAQPDLHDERQPQRAHGRPAGRVRRPVRAGARRSSGSRCSPEIDLTIKGGAFPVAGAPAGSRTALEFGYLELPLLRAVRTEPDRPGPGHPARGIRRRQRGVRPRAARCPRRIRSTRSRSPGCDQTFRSVEWSWLAGGGVQWNLQGVSLGLEARYMKAITSFVDSPLDPQESPVCDPARPHHLASPAGGLPCAVSCCSPLLVAGLRRRRAAAATRPAASRHWRHRTRCSRPSRCRSRPSRCHPPGCPSAPSRGSPRAPRCSRSSAVPIRASSSGSTVRCRRSQRRCSACWWCSAAARPQGVLLYEGTPIEAAPRLGLVSVGGRTPAAVRRRGGHGRHPGRALSALPGLDRAVSARVGVSGIRRQWGGAERAGRQLGLRPAPYSWRGAIPLILPPTIGAAQRDGRARGHRCRCCSPAARTSTRRGTARPASPELGRRGPRARPVRAGPLRRRAPARHADPRHLPRDPADQRGAGRHALAAPSRRTSLAPCEHDRRDARSTTHPRRLPRGGQPRRGGARPHRAGGELVPSSGHPRRWRRRFVRAAGRRTAWWRRWKGQRGAVARSRCSGTPRRCTATHRRRSAACSARWPRRRAGLLKQVTAELPLDPEGAHAGREEDAIAHGVEGAAHRGKPPGGERAGSARGPTTPRARGPTRARSPGCQAFRSTSRRAHPSAAAAPRCSRERARPARVRSCRGARSTLKRPLPARGLEVLQDVDEVAVPLIIVPVDAPCAVPVTEGHQHRRQVVGEVAVVDAAPSQRMPHDHVEEQVVGWHQERAHREQPLGQLGIVEQDVGTLALAADARARAGAPPTRD